jgi:formylglycine-generating enzyme required for sulfatase activity
MKKFLFTAAALLLLSAMGAKAQVHIGEVSDPQPFSILELESDGSRGLRLPQLTTAQRTALEPSLAGNTKAPGLQIFNKTTRCVETWNGTKWIQACPPEGPVVPHYISTCEDAQSCKDIIGFTAVALSGDMDFIANSVSFKMKPVTGGVFYIGSQKTEPNKYESEIALEAPVHKVALNSFYMSETEVTQALFETVMGGKLSWTSYGTGDNYPAYLVSWYDAIAFCNKLSLKTGRTPCYAVVGVDNWTGLAYDAIPTDDTNTNWLNVSCDFTKNGFRLPTEAEWEYAARGGQKNEYTRTLGTSGTQYIYSGSNNICDVAWYAGNNYTNTDCGPANNIDGTKQVKGKKANELGIYDMSGNVWELCWDWWSSSYYDDCCATNPKGTVLYISIRVARGGGFLEDSASSCRVSNRGGIPVSNHNANGGFRVVSSLPVTQ